MSEGLSNKRNYFSVLFASRAALFFRLFELLLLTAAVLVFHYLFPGSNLLTIIIVGMIAVILLSYFLFRKIFPTNYKIENNDLLIQAVPLTQDKIKFILEIIKIRLNGISEAAKRARITFIISIIASCAMLITLFNTYYSWTKRRGFDNSFKYEAVSIINESEFSQKLDSGDGKKYFTSGTDSYKKAVADIDRYKNDVAADFGNPEASTEKIENASDDKKFSDEKRNKFEIRKELLNSEIEKSRNVILRNINENLLNRIELYEDCGDGNDFYNCFSKEKKSLSEAEKMDKGTKLRNKITKMIIQTDTTNYYDPTNHLNKIILQKKFPEIVWKASVQDASLPASIYEENKRALSREWIENQNVRINLLGISVNVDQFSLIGSFTLMVITIWMLFSVRRENRSIVTLLRDVRKYVGYPKQTGFHKSGEPDNESGDNQLQPEDKEDNEKGNLHDNWKIADLTLHGIAHNLIFTQIGKYDLPMSENNIFDLENKIPEPETNNITEIATKLFRGFAYLLLFLPAISIGLILYVDQVTTTDVIYPYANNPIEYFINRNVNNFPVQIDYEINIGIAFGLITALMCFTCFIYQKRTASAMKTFEEQLGKEISPEDSWLEKYMRPRWETFKDRLLTTIFGENYKSL